MMQFVKIQGFQSHLNTTIKFAPNLTVVTGATDSGKTAIIRAIRWLAFGEPGGEAFINNAVGQALVEVTMEDGAIIRKTRKNSKTVYSIIDGDKLQSWESAAVPKEVTQRLGITKQTFGDLEATINFAYQLDAPFLISLPASAGAKVLGKIAGTEIVDMAVKDVAKDTYSARQEVSRANKTIEKIDSDLGVYAELESIRKQLEVCETLIGQLDKKSAMFQALTHLKKMYQISFDMIARKEKYLQPFEKLQDVETALQAIDVYSKKAEHCQTLTAIRKQCAETIDQKQRILLQLNELERAGAAIEVIEEAILRLDAMTKLRDSAMRLSKQIEGAKAILEDTAALNGADILVKKIIEKSQTVEALRTLQVRKMRLDAEMKRRQDVVAITQGCEKAADLLQQMEALQGKLSTLQSLRALSNVKQKLIATTLVSEQAAATATENQKESLKQLWADLKVCPLCEQPVGEDHYGH